MGYEAQGHQCHVIRARHHPGSAREAGPLSVDLAQLMRHGIRAASGSQRLERTFLPADQADDIVNELSENLRAQIEDSETDVGRALTDAELEGILNAHGKPLMVAARYRSEEQSFTFGRRLIGPALFPSYMQVLSIAFTITLVVIFIGAVVAEVEPAVGSILSSIALAAVIQFGVITGIFMAADRAMAGEGTLPADIAPVAPADVQTIATEINRWVGISLWFAIAITLAMAVFELYRLVARLRRGNVAQAG
jgi:hypothetical protein